MKKKKTPKRGGSKRLMSIEMSYGIKRMLRNMGFTVSQRARALLSIFVPISVSKSNSICDLEQKE